MSDRRSRRRPPAGVDVELDVVDTAFGPVLRGVASRSGGVVLTHEVLMAGSSDVEIARQVRSGTWKRLRRGAYVTAERWDACDEQQRHLLVARAVLRVMQLGTYLTHVSALVAYGADLHRPDLGSVHVVRDGPTSGGTAAGVVAAVSGLPEDQRGRAGDLPACVPARALLDHARDPGVTTDQAVVAMDSLLRAGLVTPDRLAAMLEHCRDWRGSLRAARAVHLADGRAESGGESIARLVLVALDLPPEALQIEVMTDIGPARSDMGWPSKRVLLEFDGFTKLGRYLRPGETPAQAAWRERERELALQRAGWIVVRLRWQDLSDLALVRRRVLDAFAHAARLGLAPA